MVSQLCEKRVPERVIFIHVQRARNAHTTTRRFMRGQAFTVEQHVFLELEQIWHLRGARCVTCAFFAAIARNEATMFARFRVAPEIVNGKQARVRAMFAPHRFVAGLKRVYLFNRKHAGAHARTIAGKECSTISSHASCNIGTHRFHFCQLLKRTQHRIV